MNRMQDLLLYAQLASHSYDPSKGPPDGYISVDKLEVGNFYAGAYANGSSVVIAVREITVTGITVNYG